MWSCSLESKIMISGGYLQRAKYSARSCYKNLFQGMSSFWPYIRIWKSWAPGKYKCFLWLVATAQSRRHSHMERSRQPHSVSLELSSRIAVRERGGTSIGRRRGRDVPKHTGSTQRRGTAWRWSRGLAGEQAALWLGVTAAPSVGADPHEAMSVETVKWAAVRWETSLWACSPEMLEYTLSRWCFVCKINVYVSL